MIKFIASDLDGTLLKPDKTLPVETFEIIEKLYKKGIIFAPASGRQIKNLEKLFAPVLDKIAIIAENGGAALFRGEIVYLNPTPADKIVYALSVIKGEKGLYPLLSGVDCAYYQSDREKFISTVKKSYTATQKVDDLCDFADKNILKISVWDEFPPCAEHGGVILPEKIKGLRAMVSGFDWLDVSVSNANKGAALLALMKILRVSAAECMAFGDHMNDLEMLETAGNSFVTANAFYKLKSKIKNEIPSCADEGVIKKLKELL